MTMEVLFNVLFDEIRTNEGLTITIIEFYKTHIEMQEGGEGRLSIDTHLEFRS